MPSASGRRSALARESHVLIRPEDTTGMIATCVYAKVNRLAGRWAWVQPQAAGLNVLKIAAETAATRVVSVAEATRHQTESWLRQAVFFVDADGAYRHGQVVSYRGTRVQVECDENGLVGSLSSALTATDPIIVLLLRGTSIREDELPAGGVAAIHDTILDRVLGEQAATNASTSPLVTEVLHDIPGIVMVPLSDSVCWWIDMASGERCSFTLRYALDFVFYMDGAGGDVADAPALGESFCRPPAAAAGAAPGAPPTQPLRTRQRGVTNASVASSDSFFASDDDDAAAVATVGAPTYQRTVQGQQAQPVPQRTASERMATALAADPDLLAHYQHLVASTPVPAPTRRPDGGADSSRVSPTTFRPSSHSVRLHEVIVARPYSVRHSRPFDYAFVPDQPTRAHGLGN